MAFDQYHHGVTVIENSGGTRSITPISTAVIGLVAWAKDADNKHFPLNTPALVTDLPTAISKAGKSGSLAAALSTINQQVSAHVVVVRVDEGGNGRGEPKNIVGGTNGAGQKTGMQALLVAEPMVGVKPRILGVPGIASDEVTANLITIARKLNAFAYATLNAGKVSDALNAVKKFGARELMPIYGDFTGLDPASGKHGTISSVACALGLRARLDQEVGWHRCLSNVPVNGVTGVTYPVSWDLQNTDTDADVLNKSNITALIQSNGYRFWGVRTCDSQKQFLFESYTRTAQVIKDTIAQAHLWAMDKPLTPMLARDIIEGINAQLRQWTSLGYLLGGKAWLREELNSKETLKGGKLIIDYDYTPIPPLENLGLAQNMTDSYLADFATRVSA